MIPIISLPLLPGPSLREQIISSLTNESEVVPGDQAEDRDWVYTKSIPTMVLYDQKGLRLYDQITEQAEEYYLYKAELNLLKSHGAEIASHMGFPQIRKQENGSDGPVVNGGQGAVGKNEKWGSAQVGTHNWGVNGQGAARLNVHEINLVELGAGSLRKTSHLLNALADTVEPSSVPPITYHALDLSQPELERTLNQLQELNGEKFKHKIEIKGLWGDYQRGIEYVRAGGLNKMSTEEAARPDPARAKTDYFNSEDGSHSDGKVIVNGKLHFNGNVVESPGLVTPHPNGTEEASIKVRSARSNHAASPLLLPRASFNQSRSNSRGPQRRTSLNSLNSFTLDDGPKVELQEEEDDKPDEYRGPRVKGVRHSATALDPIGWKSTAFKYDILKVLRELRLPVWSSPTIKAHNLHLQKVSGALTNAVFFCSFNPSDKPTEPSMSPLLTPKMPGMDPLHADTKPPTLLIRVYGPSTGTLIERDEELRILHTLSADYGLGPRIEGTFFNGRVEQFFPSHALTPAHLRDSETSLLIARRMRELHSVDLDALGFEERKEPTVWQKIREWYPLAVKAAQVLKGVPRGDDWLAEFKLEDVAQEMEDYIKWVDAREEKGKERVFCHNDTQYGNILELDKSLPPGAPRHHQLIVIDFEYAAPNYRGYDIANQFHEWQAHYHHATHSHSLSYHGPYPTPDQRERFYRAYLSVEMDSRTGEESIGDMEKVDQARIDRLEQEVKIWSPASSAFWALWGIVQGEEQIEAIAKGDPSAQVDFDYLAYALGRIQMFRQEARALGAFHKQEQTSTAQTDKPVHFLFLGSSLGNFDRESAGPFLASLPLRPGSSDSLLLGLDGRPSSSDTETAVNSHLPSQATYEAGKRKVEIAYDDPKGKTRDFILHGIQVAAEALEEEDGEEQTQSPKPRRSSLRRDSWTYKSRYNVKMGRHEAYYGSNEEQEVTWNTKDGRKNSVSIAQGELINVEWSLKYSMSETLELFEQAGLVPIRSWRDPTSNYRLWLLRRPPFYFPAKTIEPKKGSEPLESTRFGSVPTREEWTALWKYWDAITLGMIPEAMLMEKPIDLRHKCLFYLGHIPTFLDIHLTRLTNGKHTEPERFKDIFERGIDPHVDDPNQCHDHSIVPETDQEWPALKEILEFRDRVRQRVMGIYNDIDSGKQAYDRRTGRILWMTYEHEAFHAETLLYMLLQSRSTLPPPGFAKPLWADLASEWNANPSELIVLDMDATSVSLGHNDKESDDKDHPSVKSWQNHEFGWDNENPRTAVSVKAFKIESLPISNGNYWTFLQQTGAKTLPGSWSRAEGGPQIKTLYGPVSMDVAQHWPLMASGQEIAAYAAWKGGRLPTEAELRAFWESDIGPRPAGQSANVGVRRWHPIPATNTRLDSCGKTLYGHNGGVWEWTSTKFYGLKGFESSEVYPGYSADFFDDLHHVVLGGSFATLPRLAARSSLRNFYQEKYPYAWIGGRVAYDQ